MRTRLPAFVLPGLTLLATEACGHPEGPELLRDALVKGDAAAGAFVARAPACASEGGHRATKECLDGVASWLGAKGGFRHGLPDQPTAAAAGVFVLRGVGEAAPTPDAWIATIRDGSGPGADALRLAVSSRVAAEVAPLGRPLASEADARALMKGVAASVPGACESYALLGAGGAPEDPAIKPEFRVDHATCVQADLARSSGPELHGQYGFGIWRGAEGALALWKTVASALQAGAAHSSGDARSLVAARAEAIAASLQRVTTPKLPPPAGVQNAADWAASHGVSDAGAPASARGGPKPANAPRTP